MGVEGDHHLHKIRRVLLQEGSKNIQKLWSRYPLAAEDRRTEETFLHDCFPQHQKGLGTRTEEWSPL